MIKTCLSLTACALLFLVTATAAHAMSGHVIWQIDNADLCPISDPTFALYYVLPPAGSFLQNTITWDAGQSTWVYNDNNNGISQPFITFDSTGKMEFNSTLSYSINSVFGPSWPQSDMMAFGVHDPSLQTLKENGGWYDIGIQGDGNAYLMDSWDNYPWMPPRDEDPWSGLFGASVLAMGDALEFAQAFEDGNDPLGIFYMVIFNGTEYTLLQGEASLTPSGSNFDYVIRFDFATIDDVLTIPEPASGLLACAGCAMLLLRRRKQHRHEMDEA